MKKKSLVLVLGFAFALFLCVAVSGCDWNGDTLHTHEWELSASSATHYYQCSICREGRDYTPHEYDNGVCFCGEWQLNYRVNDNNEACVASPKDFLSPDTKIVIPAEYQGKPVTAIGDEAFWKCWNLTGIEIPDSVTHIDEKAFRECWGLTSIVIPKSVTNISGNAFLECKNLTSIEVDEENPVYKSENNCILTVDGQTLVVGWATDEIPNGVTRIGDYAFEGRSDLKNLQIPESVTSIGKAAFRGCNKLESIEVDSANPSYKSENDCILTVDGKTLVLGCKNSVIPNGVTRIGDYAFAGCTSLNSIEIPSSVTSVGDYVFADCSWLRRLTTPDLASIHITSVGKGVFSGCFSLQELGIPDGVTEIPDETFSGCVHLETVEIPDSVTSIGSSAFVNCKSLKNIEIPSGVTRIGDGAFMQCSQLERIVIPDGVTRIGEWTFTMCENLNEIEIPDGVTEIGDYAFEGCKALKSIVSPDGVTEIGEETFARCGLESIEIPVSVTKISKRGLSDSLKRIDYKGTKAEWEKIEKEEYWNLGFKCTVYCTDGEIDVSLPYRC